MSEIGTALEDREILDLPGVDGLVERLMADHDLSRAEAEARVIAEVRSTGPITEADVDAGIGVGGAAGIAAGLLIADELIADGAGRGFIADQLNPFQFEPVARVGLMIALTVAGLGLIVWALITSTRR